MIVGIWGDSITFGAGDKEALGWVGRLRRSLPTNDSNHFYNFGICGETSADVLKRFQVEFDAIQPEKVIFAIGINDSKVPHDGNSNLVPVSEYKQNMQTLIDACNGKVNEVVLVGPTRVLGGLYVSENSTFTDSEIVKYRHALQEIAEANGLRFIDMLDVLDPSSDLADGVHPTAKGYQKMYEVMERNLEWQ